MALLSSQIGYDMDGVLCDTMPAFQQYWLDNYDHIIDNTTLRGFEIPFGENYNFKNLHKDIIAAINMFQPYLYPHAYALELVREIGTKLNQVPIIITARHRENYDVTVAWLDHWLAYPYELIMSGNKAKADVISEQEGMLYFVEDRYKTVHSVAPVCEKVYMPRRTWNQGRELLRDNIYEVNNLIEVYNDILGEKEEVKD